MPGPIEDPIERILTEASRSRERLLSWIRAAIWATVGIPFFVAIQVYALTIALPK